MITLIINDSILQYWFHEIINKTGKLEQIFNAGFVNQHCAIFSPIFCLMFFIKPIVEKKFKTCFIFVRDCLGEGSRESTK